MTTATLSRRLALPVRGSVARRGLLLGFTVTMLGGLLLLAAASAAVGLAAGSTAMPRVSVGGVALGGLDRAAAQARLQAELLSLGAGHATITVDGQETVVAYADLGRGYQMETMLDAAFGVARGGDPLADGIARLRSVLHDTALPVQVHAFDSEALDRVAVKVGAAYSSRPVDAAVHRRGTSFTVTAGLPGTRLPADEVRGALAAVLATPDPADAVIELEATVVPPAVTTRDANIVAGLARQVVATGLSLELPASGDGTAPEPIAVAAETIAEWIGFGASFERPYDVRIEESAVWSTLAALRESVDRDARNASFSLAGSGLGGVVPGETGLRLDVHASVDRVVEALRGRAAGTALPGVPLAIEVTEPQLTTAEAEAVFPQMQMVSSWTTYYTPNDGNGYGANINIGAWDIDGQVLLPGERFSFWNSIGPVTIERGYHYGGVIIGGRSVAGGAIGGGICSTSTTIFNAALRAGLEMGSRLNHYYYIDRYPNGLDATVFIVDDHVQDMTFRNDTDAPIVIRGFGGTGFVRFDIWTVPTGRNVVLTNPVVSNRRAAIETTQLDPSLAPGTSRRVEYPHPGHDVSVTRYVYDASGELIHQNNYFSSYRAVNGITLVGPAAPKPSPKPSPTPEPPPEDDQASAA